MEFINLRLSQFALCPLNDFDQLINIYSMGCNISESVNAAIPKKDLDSRSLPESCPSLQQALVQQSAQETTEVKQIVQNPESSRTQVKKSTQQILIYSPIDRRQQNEDHGVYPYNCILKIYFAFEKDGMEDFIKGTGALIAPNMVSTSAHFLKLYEQKRGKTFIKVELPPVQSNYCMRMPFKEVIHHFYPQRYIVNGQLIQDDFGVMILNSQIKRQRYIKIGLNFNLQNYTAQVCGYEEDHRQKKMRGRILEVTEEYLLYDIDTMSGQSGSPVLVELTKDEFYMIGIHSGNYQSKIQGDKKIKKYLFYSQDNVTKDKQNSACKLGKHQQEYILQKLAHTKIESNIIWVQLSHLKLEIPLEFYGLNNSEKNQALGQQSKFISAISNPDSIASPLSYLKLANYYYKIHRNHESLSYCEKLFNKKKLNLFTVVQLYNLFALNYQELNSHQIAHQFYKRCMELIFTLRDSVPSEISTHITFVEVCNNLGTMQLQSNNITQAMHFFKQAERYLRQRNMQGTEHYAATLVNLNLFHIQSEVQSQSCKQSLINALKILNEISTVNSSHVQGKILIIKHVLANLFDRKQYSQWLSFILQHFETIILMKVHMKIYDKCSTQLEIQYNSRGLSLLARESSINDRTINLDKKANCRHFSSDFVEWNEILLKQFTLIFTRQEIYTQLGLFKVAFIFTEIFKGVESQRVKQLQSFVSTLLRQA